MVSLCLGPSLVPLVLDGSWSWSWSHLRLLSEQPLTWGCSDDATLNLNQFHSSLKKVVEVILTSRMAPKCETWACVWFWISLWGWLKFGSVLSCTAPSGHFEKWTCLLQAQPYPPSNVTFNHSLFIWVLFFMWLLPFWGNAHKKK